MNAYNFFLDQRVNEKTRKQIEEYSYLMGRKVKAIPTNESPADKVLEEELFTIVGLTTESYTTELFATLKSEESTVTINIKVGEIGKERKDYAWNPGMILKLLEQAPKRKVLYVLITLRYRLNIDNEEIKNLIYEIRKKQVMIECDMANYCIIYQNSI